MKRSKNISLILSAGFVVMISLPLLFSVLGMQSGITASENRRVQPMPSLDIPDVTGVNGMRSKAKEIYLAFTTFIRRFDTYFSTTFSFRADLLRLYNGIKIDMLDTEPLPQKVVQGSEGWFFLGDEYSNIIKESKGLENFSEAALSKLTEAIHKNKMWLDERETDFYFAVAPNKLSVYGQYLPIHKTDKITQLQQLKNASQNKFNFVDLKTEFASAPQARLYYKTDSHWNDYGAFLGYTALLKAVSAKHPEITMLSKEEFSIDTSYSFQQDLTRMLAIKVKEEVITFKPKKVERAVLQKKQLAVPRNYNRPPDNYEQRYKSDVNNLKVLVLHDSFTTHLMKFIKENFGETVFIWDTRFDRSLIETEKPDIVIQIIVERHLELAGR